MSIFPSARDRLLLAFANLASYGIYTRPAVDGSPGQARGKVSAEAARRTAFAANDYVFWCRDDEPLAFDMTGALIGTLPLHLGNRSLAAAIEHALSDAGFSDLPAADNGELEPARYTLSLG
jgi:hypothetical protein